MITLTVMPTVMQRNIILVNLLIVFILFGTFLIIMTLYTDDDTSIGYRIKKYILLSIVTITLSAIGCSSCDSAIKKQGYKLLRDTPATKLTQTSVERNLDHTEYIYQYKDSRGVNYVILSGEKINLSGYTVKIPQDSWYKGYICLFKHRKFVKDYMNYSDVL